MLTRDLFLFTCNIIMLPRTMIKLHAHKIMLHAYVDITKSRKLT